MALLGRLASLRTDSTVYTQPSFEKDGEALRKFLLFDTKSISCVERKPEKPLRRSLFAVASFLDCKTRFYCRLRWWFRNYTRASLSRVTTGLGIGTEPGTSWTYCPGAYLASICVALRV